MEPGNYFKSIDQVAKNWSQPNTLQTEPWPLWSSGPSPSEAALSRREPGVGKTEVGTVMAKVFKTSLIRLQCYEGLDASAALYEWNYSEAASLHSSRRAGEKEEGRNRASDLRGGVFSSSALCSRPFRVHTTGRRSC